MIIYTSLSGKCRIPNECTGTYQEQWKNILQQSYYNINVSVEIWVICGVVVITCNLYFKSYPIYINSAKMSITMLVNFTLVSNKKLFHFQHVLFYTIFKTCNMTYLQNYEIFRHCVIQIPTDWHVGGLQTVKWHFQNDSFPYLTDHRFFTPLVTNP